jgi:hypothetical protein
MYAEKKLLLFNLPLRVFSLSLPLFKKIGIFTKFEEEIIIDFAPGLAMQLLTADF